MLWDEPKIFFLERRYFFSIILSEFLKNRVALQHRSFLVNLDYVQSLSYRAITMSCLTEIPLPRGKYAEVKDAFLERAFQRGRVLL